jgi:Sec-independent protein translocase protein TatA
MILIATTNVSTVRSSRSNAIPTAFISNGSQNLQKQTQSRFMGNTMKLIPTTKITASSNKKNMRKGTELGMFLGNDGGILGVGAPEIAVTLLVGYFILGPSDLYKLVKEIGKFIQNFRTLGAEASKSFESSMENQLELDELRKAQTELNSAFGFRRSINVDQTADAFTSVPSSEDANVAAATATALGSSDSSSDEPGAEGKKKKRKRRRVKKKKAVVEEEPMMSGSGEIPDLDMSAAFRDEITQEIQKASTASSSSTITSPSESTLRQERMDRLTNGQPTAPSSETNPDWFSASESDIASEVMGQQNQEQEITQPTVADNNRFASQLSGDWNQQILDKGDELSPIGNIMDQIALLEDERNAATKRLEEEFRMRAEIDENFYREKREVLEVAAAEISTRAFASEYEDLSATTTTTTPTPTDDDKEKEKDIKKTDGKSSDVEMKAEDKNKNVGSATS